MGPRARGSDRARGYAITPPSDLRANRPQFRIKRQIQRFLQIAHAARSAGARLVADDAFDRLHMAEAPEMKAVFEIDELLGQFVQIPMRVHVAIDKPPRFGD